MSFEGVFVELRRRFTLWILSFFIFAFSLWAQAQYETVVSTTPLDVFTDRSGRWTSQKIQADRIHSESLNPYEGLNRLTGLQSRYEGSPTISIRGSQSLPRVLGMFNGVPLNGAGGFGANRYLIPHEAIEEVRVFKGPASVFYGGDAMGGAVNFISRRLERPTVRGQVGSFGQRSLLGALPFATSENSYQHITSFAEHYDGNYPYTWATSGTTGERANNNRSFQRHSYFGEQRTGRWSFSENLLWSQEIGTTPGPVNSLQATDGKSTNALASLSTNYNFSGEHSLSHRVFGIRGTSEYRDSTGNSATENSTVGNSLNLRTRWSPEMTSDLFVDHKYDDFKNTYSGNQYYLTSDTEAGGTFDYSINENLVLKPGLRYLFSYQRFVSALGLFEEQEHLKKWLTYSEGFHAPSLIQRYANNSYALANPDLKPESSSQVEIGFRQTYPWDSARPWNKAGIELSVFSISYRDFIVSESITSTLKRPKNLSTASGRGVEAQGDIEYEVFKARAAYSYLKTEDSSQNQLPLSPENQYQVAMGMSWAMLYFEAQHTIWDKFYDNYGSVRTLNSWHSTDLSIETESLNDWEIKLAVLNVFDQPIELGYGYPEPQRRYLLSVERVF